MYYEFKISKQICNDFIIKYKLLKTNQIVFFKLYLNFKKVFAQFIYNFD